MSKTFLFQATQFTQTVVIQTILFSASIVFVYTQLNLQRVQFQTLKYCVWGPQEYIDYELVLASPAVSCVSGS